MRASLLLLLAMHVATASAQPPPGYYDPAQGLTGEALRTVLADIISPHSVLANSQLWAAFARTDRKADGTVWDMYSDVPSGIPPYTYQFVVNQCGNYNSEGDCFNREHTFPVSWFNDAPPMNTDLHHLYPADAWVNQQRGNWPYGIVTSPAWTSQNGGKRGPCAWPGCSGTVFEPIDAYKGDLARAHLYMLTRYMGESATWSSPVQSGGIWLTWVEGLLLTWHNQDPVSQKELARNDSVFVIQGNRNPYIDHPEWVARIWGPEASVDEFSANSFRTCVADGQLRIDCGDCTRDSRIMLIDCTGRLISTLTLDAGSWHGRITASPGIYLLKEESTPRPAARFRL
jgi:endonuclease I